MAHMANDDNLELFRRYVHCGKGLKFKCRSTCHQSRLGRLLSLHIAVAAELLKCMLALFVLGTTGAFGRAAITKLLDDVANAARIGLNGKCAGRTAETSISLPLLIRKIK